MSVSENSAKSQVGAAKAENPKGSLRDRQTKAFNKVKPDLARDIDPNDIMTYFRANNLMTEGDYDEIRKKVSSIFLYFVNL